MGSARHRDPGGGSRDAPACTEDAVGSPRAHPKPETSQQLWGLYSEQIPRSAVPEDAGQKTASCVCVWLPPPEKDHVMRRQVPGQQPAGGRGRWAGRSHVVGRVGFPTMSEPLSAFPGPGRGMSHGLRASPALRPPEPPPSPQPGLLLAQRPLFARNMDAGRVPLCTGVFFLALKTSPATQ